MLRNVNPSPPPSNPSTVKCVRTWNQQIHLISNADDDQSKWWSNQYISWCNQEENAVGIARPKYQEQEKLDHNIRWAGNTKIYNSMNLSLQFFIILCWHSLVLWWAPHFCIFVYMEEIKSYYGMNLEQNLPFSWAPFKTGRKQGMVDGWKSKRVQPFKIERTNLQLETGQKRSRP